MAKQKKIPLYLLVVSFLFGLGFTFISPKIQQKKVVDLAVTSTLKEVDTKDLSKEVFEYGMRVDTFAMYKLEVLPNEFVSQILERFKVQREVAIELTQNASKIHDFRKFRAGNTYTVLADRNANDTIGKYLVYEKNPIEYVVYNLTDPNDIQLKERPTTRVERVVSGEINGSLWNSLIDAKADPDLAVKLANVYQWTIDFTRIQPGDSFKAVFDEVYVDGKFYKSDSIAACYFNHNGKDYYAIYFDQGEDHLNAGYYDENGESLKRQFLRAPVKFSRISSRYSGRRFHPVQKRYKAHLGTDYAAPSGTPIFATANGTVIAASYTRGNGNYVKIKHNSTYTTQYLHMSKRAVRNGQKVSQGQVIGYVGSTGLSTGPHVCYRFWKNGVQVDHLSLNLPNGDPIQPKNKAEFQRVKDVLIEKLNQTSNNEIPEPKPIVDEAGFGL